MKGLEGMAGTVGLGHTHWATRGRPCTENAHPHTDCRGALRRAGQKSALEIKVALVTQEISV